MTWFYKCKDCGKILGFGKSGKACVTIIEVYGSCCYEFSEEIKEINNFREKNGLDKQELKKEIKGEK